MGNETSSLAQQYAKRISNDITIKWTKDECNYPFLPREGQAAASIGSKVYIFGGVVFDRSGNTSQDDESNELLVYDTVSQSWSKQDPAVGDVWPSPRSGATMSAVDQQLYLFGGLSQYSGWMNDLYCYDTQSKCWRQIEAVGGPSPRDKLMSSSLEGCIYIFGGFGPVVEDVMSSDEILPDTDNDSDEYEDLQEVQETQEAAKFTWSNELFVFNTESGVWTAVKSNSKALPSPRAAHSLAFTTDRAGNKCLFVFGGRDSESRQNDLWKFDLNTNEWSIISCLGCCPEPRSFHAMVSVKERLIVHGGRGIANQHFDDLHIFNVESNEWLQPHIDESSTIIPLAMGLHSLCVVDEDIVLFGGTSDLDPATGTCTTFHNHLMRVKNEAILAGGPIKMIEIKGKENEADQANIPAILNLKASVQKNNTDGEPISFTPPSP